MLYGVRGKITGKQPGHILLDTGSGYIFDINTPASYYFELSEGDEVFFFTVVKIKDEDINLFGFLNKDQKNFFLKMISVSGIGTKTALLLISSFSPQEFLSVIESGDIDKLSSIPGIGKKTAQRVVLELTGKLSFESIEESVDFRLKNELISALINLGFSAKNAKESVTKVLKENNDEKTFEKLFRLVLKDASNLNIKRKV